MSHRIHTDLYRVPKRMADPGAGGTIRVTQDLQICEMVSLTSESRTLAAPTKQGIRFVLRLMTAGGTVLVTAENGYNISGDTVATFAEASDLLQLISVEVSTGVFRWEVAEGNVGVTLAA